MQKLAIIGCGPMGLYALREALTSEAPIEIEIFEASDMPGSGMPYSPQVNSSQMLCNAFSREIPPLIEPFIVWIRRQDPEFFEARGLSEEQFGSRSFYPRTLLGEYFEAQLAALQSSAEKGDRSVLVHAGHCVDDIVPTGRGFRIEGHAADRPFTAEAEHVIIATGHDWAEEPELGGVKLTSPWPASRLEALPPVRIGIIGSSLSAIDVALAVGGANGVFEEHGAGTRWLPSDSTESLRITMLSREGVMPEPDFYYPYPYEALAHLTDDAVLREAEVGQDGLLDRLFALLQADIDEADPKYFESVESEERGLDGFAQHYFRQRTVPDGLTALRSAMKEAKASFDQKEPIPHRHVLLRASEVLDRAVRKFSNDDFRRFSEHLRPVLADAYAAVPHRSVGRVLALHDAGVLNLLATGEAAQLRAGRDGCVTAAIDGETLTFDVVIDARGQSSSSLERLPFPSLVANLAETRPLEAPFRLSIKGNAAGSRAYCLSMPQLLERHPFAQGLAECAALSRIAVRDFLANAEPDYSPENSKKPIAHDELSAT